MFGICEIVASSELNKLQAINQYNVFIKIFPDLGKIDVNEFVSLQESERNILINNLRLNSA